MCFRLEFNCNSKTNQIVLLTKPAKKALETFVTPRALSRISHVLAPCSLLLAPCSCLLLSHILTFSLSYNYLASKRVALKQMTQITDKFESLIQGMLEDEYGMVEDFISPALVERLRNNLLARMALGKMSPAGIGQHSSFQENSQVRSDQISWIEDDQSDIGEEEYFRLLWDFLGYLNQTCYTGLNAFESHYARYDQGSFYKRHLDQFKADSGRKYSVVLYLNDRWLEDDGGQLLIYRKADQVSISPLGGKVVFFQSDRNEHEVLPATRARMSIAGWMKQIH